MASSPVATVVIPTYNRAALALRAIDSVLHQSFEDWELVVVDDAGTDDTRGRVARLREIRIRYVHRDVNGGVAAAQNTGLDHAAGRYVMFLHSDDELLPGSLARLSRVLDEAPTRVGAVESGFDLVEPKETTRRRPHLERATADDVLALRADVHISTLMLRRDLACTLRFDEALRGVEDRDFCIRLLRQTELAFAPEPLVRIGRLRPGLRSQSKGPIYEYLLDKYHDDIVVSPVVHGTWLFRIARAHARAGDLRRARASMRRAVRTHPARIRRWPLAAAAHLGDRPFSAMLRAYRVLAGISSRGRSGVRSPQRRGAESVGGEEVA